LQPIEVLDHLPKLAMLTEAWCWLGMQSREPKRSQGYTFVWTSSKRLMQET